MRKTKKPKFMLRNALILGNYKEFKKRFNPTNVRKNNTGHPKSAHV